MLPRVPFRLPELTADEAVSRGTAWHEKLEARRSVRDFSDRPVPRALIELAIQTASTAPSGAHKQPWTFVAVSNPDLKRRIREAAEAEEKASYDGRMSEEWRRALEPLGTTWEKPYLETVPWIVVLFAQRWGHTANGDREKHYYVMESCGIAAGVFITALHEMGLATLTHTPSPMGFLTELLQRPSHEKPMILFPVGHPTADCTVPELDRKTLGDVSAWFE